MDFDDEWLAKLRQAVEARNLDAVSKFARDADAMGPNSPAVVPARLLAATARLAVGLVVVRETATVANELDEFARCAMHAALAVGHGSVAKDPLDGIDLFDLNRYLRPYADRPGVAMVRMHVLWWLDRAEGERAGSGSEAKASVRMAYRAGNTWGVTWLTVGRLPYPAAIAVQHRDGLLASPPTAEFTQAMDAAIPGHWWRVDQPGTLDGHSAQGGAAGAAECLRQGWKPRDDVLVMARLGPDRRLEPVDGELEKAQRAVNEGVRTIAVPDGSAFTKGAPVAGSRVVVVRTISDAAEALAGRRRRWWPPIAAAAIVAALIGTWLLRDSFESRGQQAAGVASPVVATSPPGVVELHPQSGSEVGQQQLVSGRTVGLSGGDEAYLVVVPDALRRYYVQGGPVAKGNKSWSTTIALGDEPGSGEQFRMLVVVPDADDRQTFDRYLSGGSGGLAALSPGTRVLGDVQYRLPLQLPKVEVRTPAPGDGVDKITVATGTARDVLRGQRIWAIVKVDDGHYPQLSALDVPPGGGLWALSVLFGKDDDVGKPFTLLVVLASPEAHEAFTAWIERGRATGDYPGMREGVDYPAVTTLAASAVVRR